MYKTLHFLPQNPSLQSSKRRVELLTLLLLHGIASAQNTAGTTELDRSSIRPSVDSLIQTVAQAVTSSGGNLEHQNVHWVIAFSTGHFKADPLAAQAAREVASELIDREAVTGDQVSARAWEMQPWTFRNISGLTQQIGTDTQQDKAAVGHLWPTTPAVGSLGGHDTEQAAVSLSQEFDNSPNTVLILLTNTAASVGPSGSKLLGTNAATYQNMLQKWIRVPGTQDGASLNLPYIIKTPGNTVASQLQAVVLLPKVFTSTSLGNTSRTELLQKDTEQPVGPKQGSAAGPLLATLLGIGVLSGLIWFFFRMKGGKGQTGRLRVSDSNFSLADMPSGKPFCVIAGSGYREDNMVVVPVQGFPAERVAELTRNGNEIKIRGVNDTIELRSLDGRIIVGNTATIPLRLDNPDHQLEFGGEVRGSGGISREINSSLSLSYHQGE